MKIHECDGINAFIFSWERRRLSGWSYAVNEGDLVRVPMVSGKVALLKVLKINRMSDPRDQYFADLEDAGYEE